MAKLTWLGAEGYEAGETPPDSCTWAGITFPVGVAVEVDQPVMIAKAKGNRFFKVEDNEQATQWREPETEADPADVSFFDDPPGIEEPQTAFGPDLPPDYPPEDNPERKRKRGRPPNVKV